MDKIVLFLFFHQTALREITELEKVPFMYLCFAVSFPLDGKHTIIEAISKRLKAKCKQWQLLDHDTSIENECEDMLGGTGTTHMRTGGSSVKTVSHNVIQYLRKNN